VEAATEAALAAAVAALGMARFVIMLPESWR